MEKMLTVQDAAERLQCSPDLVTIIIRRGELPAIQVGYGTMRKRWRIAESDLEAFVASKKTAAIVAAVPSPLPIYTNRKRSAYKPKMAACR